jgi:predicted permease
MTHLRQGSGGQGARPPLLASWLIARVVPERRREEVLGDFEELYQIRHTERGRAEARWWYWRQSADVVIDAMRERRRRPRQPAGDSLMLTILQDLRYATRSLVAKPGFTLVAVLMLALGIGANATIFSWVNSVLLNPLPGAAQPGSLVQLAYLFKGDVLTSFSYLDYQDLRRGSRLVTGMAGRDDLAVGVVIDRDAERAWSEIVTANYFDVLGVPMTAGRGFIESEDRPGGAGSVVLSHAYWSRRFASDPAVIGRAIKINSQPFTIVGIAAEGFLGGESGLAFDLWMPMGMQPLVMSGGTRLEGRGNRWMSVLGRLAPGTTPDQARDELNSVLAGMRQAFASQNRYVDQSMAVFTLDRSPTGGVSLLRPVLLILMAVAAVVLLIACANLAGLLLARATSRQREVAIRLSMGAGRGRIVQQLLVEGALLAGLGWAAAMLSLQWTAGLLVGFAPPSELPIQLNVEIDGRVLWFTAALAIGTVILFALAPAALAAPTDLAGSLRESGSASRGFGRHRLRRALVVTQVALSVVLLVGAGLCLRSLQAATQMTPGFDARNVTVGWLDMFSAGYTADEGRAFYSRALERVRALPGVEGASISRRIPLGFTGGSSSDVRIDGYSAAANEIPIIGLHYVGSNYMSTLKIQMVAGRDITDADVNGQPLVAVISESMARKYWKDANPIGGRFTFRLATPDDPQWLTVVGVVKDIKQRSFTERAVPHAYVPLVQFYGARSVLNVRAASGVDITADLQRVMRELDPSVPFYNLSRLEEQTKAATFQQQLIADLLVVFGALALLLAGVGSYGVLSFLVGLRRREIGIRIAVGATRGEVFRLIAASGARVVAIGVVIGLVLSIGVGIGLQSLLIGIQPSDPITYAGVMAALTLVTAAACLLPARRAAAMDPVTTLREE